LLPFHPPAATDAEPERRRQLRAARLAERNAKMKAALAGKLAAEAAEAAARAEQVRRERGCG
jgi:hypothetical protein